MKLTINGEQQVVETSKLNVVDLLRIKDVEAPEMVSVQLNGTILERNQFESTAISEGDEVEFLYFMGGGR